MTSPRKAQLRDFFDTVWNAGDEVAVDRHLAETYVIHHDPHDPWHGLTLDRATFKARLRQARAPFPDQRFEILRMTREADAIAVAWTWRGTHTGEMAGMPPTGKVIIMTGITFYDFEENRIAGHWQEVDRLGVWRQLAGG
jgi:steroid delta-isomerase-like uncharacterized protein